MPAQRLVLNEELFNSAWEKIWSLYRDLQGQGIPPPDMSLALGLPGVLGSQEHALEPDQALVERVGTGLEQGLVELVKSREGEGRGLAVEMMRIVHELESTVETVSKAALDLPETLRTRLHKKLRKLEQAGDVPELDQGRLAQEVAIMAERCDIEEEISRAGIHLERFRELIRQGGEVGRRLEFLCQELLRELNTMASKARNAPVQLAVVEGKGLVDKLREQSQNIE